MIDIESIIRTLDTKEHKAFIDYLSKKNKRNDTKNIQLFKLLADDDYDKKNIVTKLYGSDNKNAYHGLRNRLFDSLIDFTANKNLEDENSIDIQIIKYILASRTFLLQKNFPTAYKLLDKAEKLADENSLFPILNEIYHTKIQYAADYPKADLKTLIKKQEDNHKKHKLEDQLNIIYSKLKSAIKAVGYEKTTVNFEALLKETLEGSDIKIDESLSFKSLYQILAVANISAIATSKYYEIEDFVLKSYKILKNKKETDKQLYYQIQIVYIIANTLFRNKKFEYSIKYIEEMEQLMLQKKRKYYKDFILKSTLIKALNLNYNNGFKEAISITNQALQKKHNDIEALLDLRLSLVMFYFQHNDLKLAKTVLSKFYHTDNWYIKKAGIDWVIKKNIAEILLFIELQEDDLFESRLNSFRRQYSKYLKSIDQSRILIFLDFAESYYKNPTISTSKKFIDKVEASFEWKTKREEDIFVMSFYAWLKSKTKNKPLYESTLELIKK
ncbi:hypothetical protein BTO05_06415 [Winogradskyella sp. PC-19]|uniref:hypothetical protein n=1 Tax=unclassified Winogradskyella TaxID=2615021 RepID=UPI000B3C5412|nr:MULTISPECIES: hypothetical protein [unclassified Winogradskyella]ARV09288.1 hypothetical protein BTO05_06415 [Winogradskyella sp. PC-19]RZN75610.1 MAG: hypothetical protein EVB12_07085 [Winogradskyella sp.]